MKKTMFVMFAVLCFCGGASVSPGIKAKMEPEQPPSVDVSADSLSASMERLQVATERLNRLKR